MKMTKKRKRKATLENLTPYAKYTIEVISKGDKTNELLWSESTSIIGATLQEGWLFPIKSHVPPLFQ